jgi:hypothetical protein
MPDSPWSIGDAVALITRPRYLKSADPMPMLRPPDLVDPLELGEVVALKALDQVAVKFRRGTFLFDAADLEAADRQVGGA